MKRKYIYFLLLVVISLTGLLILTIAYKHNAVSCIFHEKDDESSLRELMIKKRLSEKDLSIIIIKHQYQLQVIADRSILRTYPVVFGSNPVDNKLQEGDYCTPEGTFKIKSKYPHDKWSKFLWLDYPNNSSYDHFNAAKKTKAIPIDAKIGGEIGIHGVRKWYNFFIPLRINWTKGCISMRNDDVDELYDVIPTGTKVTITR